jgi:hypothetical protein
MGLDNIPKNYPCKTQGTAVLEPRLDENGSPRLDDKGSPLTTINCDKTAECGGCTWKNDYEASGLRGGQVSGIFGTSCWYRGKYGNYLLERLGHYDEDGSVSFYGDNEDGTEKSAQDCADLASIFDESIIEYRITEEYEAGADDDTIIEAKYASWWLNWVAEKADGSVCWF